MGNNFNVNNCAPMINDDSHSIKELNELKTPDTCHLVSDTSNTNDIDIINHFEKLVINKQILNAMSIIDQFSHSIDFSDHYFHNGDTCIHYAIRLHNIKFLYFLLQKGFNPNMTNELTNDTPIHIATKHNDLIIVAILLKFKADPKIRNILNKTPIDIAKKMDDTKIIDLMNNDNAFDTKSTYLDTPFKPRFTDFKSSTVSEGGMDGFIVFSDYERSNRNLLTPSVSATLSKQKSMENTLEPASPTQIIINTINNIERTKLILNDWIFQLRIKGNSKIYQKMYLFIRDYHLIWHSKKVTYKQNTKLQPNQLSKYAGFVHLFLIKHVSGYKSKKGSGYKFIITTHHANPKTGRETRMYVFKCDTKSKRDNWVNALTKYTQYLSKMISSLQNTHV